MMNGRRSFLQSLLFLPSLLAVDAFAQENAPSPIAFSDFESGDYSDWTITGDAFGTRPATDALFPGKVRGFGGKSYASTFSPRRGVLATGKAVSRGFTIEKPVITFRIGGGNHPGSACLNLVVDGKVERTETGDGSAQLLSRSWDVSALVGKTAHLEIVDGTQSDRRGYVMVDDIQFGDGSLAVPAIDFNNLLYQSIITEIAERWRRDYGLPGVWCAFIKDGRVQACVASGTRKVNENLPASVNDHLNVGSVSKVITGSLIAFFVADGTVKYETTLGEVFPELAMQFPANPLLKATLRQLMSHTAGITGFPSYGDDKSGGVAWRYGQLKLTLSLPKLREPGTSYEYSNVGIVIAVAMVEHLKKTSYESWINGALGQSIGLTNPTSLSWTIAPERSEVYPHYLTLNKTEIGSLVMSNRADTQRFYAPQGSCSITLTDWCSFAQFTMNNSAKMPETIYHDMTHRPNDGLKSDTSASWHVSSGGYLFHDGNTGRGEFASMRVDVARKRAFILYTNANHRDSDGGSNHGGNTGAFALMKRDVMSVFTN